MPRQSQSSGVSDPHPDSSILIILMGASNLARGYAGLANCLTRVLHPAPVEILHASGPGRAYCVEGGLFNVTYPPIGTCGIGSAVRERAAGKSRVAALLTDIGNDIMYGVSADEIIRCLGNLIDELRGLGAGVLATSIHVDLERDVGETYFKILRSVFYPGSGIQFSEAASAVRQINAFLEESAKEKITLLRGVKEYCGADKIHYSLFKSHRFWSEVAGELVRLVNGASPGRVSPVDMADSLCCYLCRLFFTDMLPLMKKGKGSY